MPESDSRQLLATLDVSRELLQRLCRDDSTKDIAVIIITIIIYYYY